MVTQSSSRINYSVFSLGTRTGKTVMEVEVQAAFGRGGGGAVDWKGAWGSFPQLNLWFSESVLIVQVWRQAGKNFSHYPFMVSTLKFSDYFFFAAAGFNNFRNNFRKLSIFHFLLSDINWKKKKKQQPSKLCWGCLISVLPSCRGLRQVVWGQRRHMPGIRVFLALTATTSQGQGH